jgi:hypothetical protein
MGFQRFSELIFTESGSAMLAWTLLLFFFRRYSQGCRLA